MKKQKKGITERVYRRKNMIYKTRKAVHCCEEMAKELFDNPYKNYSYHSNSKAEIESYDKKLEDGSWIPILKCPFCEQETRI